MMVVLENDLLRVTLAPEIGGRVTSLAYKPLELEFLWRNRSLSLRRSEPGDPYDPNFYGGIDEVIPGDMPEVIAGLENPDHGELWTLALDHRYSGERLVLEGVLPRWGLSYRREIALRAGEPWIDIDYVIENVSGEPRAFLWKMHAALVIAPGDAVVCPARKAVAADPAWSRWETSVPFDWSLVDGQRADLIPAPDGTTDFLFLYDLSTGWMGLRKPEAGLEFGFQYDLTVFPYACYFASYGGLDGHYTAVLEPATAMPVSVNEASALGQCSRLQAAERLETRVSVYAGPLRG